MSTSPRVEAVCASAGHTMAKPVRPDIHLVAGLGVEGDVHADAASRRQVHLVPGELLDELGAQGFELAPGQVGENVTTRGVDLARLATGTRLHLGAEAVVELTGLRTPCRQLEAIHPGLRKAMAGGRAGAMAVVVTAGHVRGGDPIVVEPPGPPHQPLRLI